MTYPRSTVSLMAVAHDPTHDPLIDHSECWVCYQALSSAWAYLAPELKGQDPREMVEMLRRALLVIV